MSLPEVLAELQERNGVHLLNISPDHEERYGLLPNEFIGAPRATEFMTVEQLKAVGIRGLYRRAQRNHSETTKPGRGF